jgi:hypothetical protein
MLISRIKNSKAWHAGALLFYAGLFLWIGAQLWENFGPKPKVPRTTTDVFGLCRNTVLQEIESPDKTKVATLGVSDCGGTTGWQTGINILHRANGKTYRGLLLLQGRPDDYRIRWENEYTVIASGFRVADVLALRKEDLAGAKVVLNPLDLDRSKQSTSAAQ